MNTSSDSLPCDIVILPEETISAEAMRLSDNLKQHGTYFTLKDGEYYPHASLYMTQLKVSDLDRVCEILADIASKTPSLAMNAREYHQEAGYIDVEYERFTLVDELQMTVVNAINPIRDGMREKDKARLLTSTGLEHDNVERYGYRSIGELFAPHLTLTRFTQNEPISTGSLPNLNTFSGKFVKLGLFEMGDNGTCVRKIAEFKLGTVI